MTRIALRDIDTMTDPARTLTLERGNLNVYRALANAERVFTGWMMAGRAALTSPLLSPRLRELVILRVAYLMDSPYEIAQHTTVAAQAGVTTREIAALTPTADAATGGFSDTELAIVRLTTELIQTKDVGAELFEQVRSALPDEASVEILMLINRWAGLALILNALDVDLVADVRWRCGNARHHRHGHRTCSTHAGPLGAVRPPPANGLVGCPVTGRHDWQLPGALCWVSAGATSIC
jgi:AhpD family alkylhydroperoxidase